MEATYLELTVRLSFALVLGGAIGIEREYRAKEAGFRTHFLVALGSALFCIVSQFGLMNLNYEYEGFGVDLLKQQRPMVFYSADNQIVARDHQRCFVYNPSMSRSFCYDVLPNGNLKETKQESKFQDLKNYVFSNIQAAEYIERHQQ